MIGFKDSLNKKANSLVHLHKW